MSAWSDLLRQDTSTPRIYEAIVAEDVSDVDDEISVIVPAFHPEREWGPAPWMPRVDDSGATVYPAHGDRALIVLAESVEPGAPELWVIAWWAN
jgi:hypothetical protein